MHRHTAMILPWSVSLIEKARACKGLNHREAAVLLECEDPQLLEEIYALAREIKQRF